MKFSSWLLIFLSTTIIIYLLMLEKPSPLPVRTAETRLLRAQLDSETQKLEKILNRLAVEDAIVMLTIVDQTVARSGSVLDLFLKSFRVGEHTKRFLNQLLILAVDDEAFMYCNSKHHSCFLLDEPGMESLTWRNDIVLKILQLGYNIIFTKNSSSRTVVRDVGMVELVCTCDGLGIKFVFKSHPDVMWLRNPIIGGNPLSEITIACDFSSQYPENTSDHMDGELIFIKSETRLIELLKLLKVTKYMYPGTHNAPLCKILQDNNFFSLDIDFFNKTIVRDFCQPSWDISIVNTIHASCCDNTKSKVHDMKLVLDDWKRFNTLQSAQNITFNSWQASNKCKGRLRL
ncbi:hypothetical protein ACFE04_010389 [Oxalis oulophora]